MNRLMRNLAALFFASCFLAGPAWAAGDNCQNVKINFTNSTSFKEIKVEKLWYWDNDINDWRQEYTWTTLWIPVNETRSRTRNLERVENEQTKIRIRWGRHDSVRMIDRYTESEYFTCHDSCEVNIDIKG